MHPLKVELIHFLSIFHSSLNSQFLLWKIILKKAQTENSTTKQQRQTHSLHQKRPKNRWRCMLETDRRVITDQVLQLFDEALEPAISVAFDGTDDVTLDTLDTSLDTSSPLMVETLQEIRHITSYPTKEEIIDQFNAYVRGPLCDSVVKLMGKGDYMSFKLCTVATLPIVFQGLLFVLGCEGNDCETSAALGGYNSINRYMLATAIEQLVLLPLACTLLCPLVLLVVNGLDAVVDSIWHMLLGTLLGAAIAFVMDLFLCFQLTMLAVAINSAAPMWCLGFLGSLTLELTLVWNLFFRNQHPHPRRSLVAWSKHGCFQEITPDEGRRWWFSFESCQVLALARFP